MKNQPELVSRVQLEIREDDWQGTEFKYPAYRVALPDLGPYDGAMDSECRPFIFTAPFSVYCFAEGASSRDAAALAGTVVRVLVNRRLDTDRIVPVTRITLPLNGILMPVPERDRLWRAEVRLSMVIKTKGSP